MPPYIRFDYSVSLVSDIWNEDPEEFYVEFHVEHISILPSGHELIGDRKTQMFQISPDDLDDDDQLFQKLKIMASHVSLGAYPRLIETINDAMWDLFINYPLGNDRLLRINVYRYTETREYDEEEVVDGEMVEALENSMEEGFGGVPSSKSFIENLKISKYEGVRGKKEACSICMEDYVEGAGVTSLACAHLFHGECIVPWLEKSNLCPLCRNKMPTENENI